MYLLNGCQQQNVSRGYYIYGTVLKNEIVKSNENKNVSNSLEFFTISTKSGSSSKVQKGSTIVADKNLNSSKESRMLAVMSNFKRI